MMVAEFQGSIDAGEASQRQGSQVAYRHFGLFLSVKAEHMANPEPMGKDRVQFLKEELQGHVISGIDTVRRQIGAIFVFNGRPQLISLPF